VRSNHPIEPKPLRSCDTLTSAPQAASQEFVSTAILGMQIVPFSQAPASIMLCEPSAPALTIRDNVTTLVFIEKADVDI
jgi:hypothetical protein